MSAADELHEWAARHDAWAKARLESRAALSRETQDVIEKTGRCACSHSLDGSVTDFLCPIHADTDPCLTMATVTGRRRKGTIRRGVCSACGHRSES